MFLPMILQKATMHIKGTLWTWISKKEVFNFLFWSKSVQAEAFKFHFGDSFHHPNNLYAPRWHMNDRCDILWNRGRGVWGKNATAVIDMLEVLLQMGISTAWILQICQHLVPLDGQNIRKTVPKIKILYEDMQKPTGAPLHGESPWKNRRSCNTKLSSTSDAELEKTSSHTEQGRPVCLAHPRQITTIQPYKPYQRLPRESWLMGPPVQSWRVRGHGPEADAAELTPRLHIGSRDLSITGSSSNTNANGELDEAPDFGVYPNCLGFFSSCEEAEGTWFNRRSEWCRRATSDNGKLTADLFLKQNQSYRVS